MASDWLPPCHFQIGVEEDIEWIDSGLIDIVARDRATTTWEAKAVESPFCTGAPTSTSTSAPDPSADAAAQSAASQASSDCPTAADDSWGPGTVAGIGIGVAISAGAVALAALAWFVHHRRTARTARAAGPAERPMAELGATWGAPQPVEIGHGDVPHSELSASTDRSIGFT